MRRRLFLLGATLLVVFLLLLMLLLLLLLRTFLYGDRSVGFSSPMARVSELACTGHLSADAGRWSAGGSVAGRPFQRRISLWSPRNERGTLKRKAKYKKKDKNKKKGEYNRNTEQRRLDCATRSFTSFSFSSPCFFFGFQSQVLTGQRFSIGRRGFSAGALRDVITWTYEDRRYLVRFLFFSSLFSPPPPPSAFFFFFFFGRSMEIITWESVEEILRHRIAFGSREDKKTSILFVCFYHHRDERPDWLPGMASLPLASFNQSQSNQEYFKVKLIFKVTSTCYFRS